MCPFRGAGYSGPERERGTCGPVVAGVGLCRAGTGGLCRAGTGGTEKKEGGHGRFCTSFRLVTTPTNYPKQNEGICHTSDGARKYTQRKQARGY